MSALQRVLLAGHVVWFYLGKLFWPVDLTFVYPRALIDATSVRAWFTLLGLGVLAVALAKRGYRSALVALALFAGALFPVLGFFNLYPFIYTFVADHFQYLASLPVIAFVAAGLARFGRAGVVTGTLLALVLATLTWQQARDFQTNETLFRATIAKNPDAWMAHNNLGKELLRDRAHVAAAIACFERALKIRPEYFEARNNLGLALAGCGRAEEAVTAFRRAARLNPAMPNLHENLAKALQLLGRGDEAAAEFAEAARLRAIARSSAGL